MKFIGTLVKSASSVVAVVVIASGLQARAADEFQTFWHKFAAAIEKNDKVAVVAMTKLPYMYDGKMLNREQFLKKYDSIFDPKSRKCIPKQKPLRDRDSWEVFCGEEIFLFSKVNGKYMFTEIGVND